MKIFWQLLLQLVLIGLNAFFACAEIAVLSVNEARLAQLEEQGNKKARRLAKLTKDPARFLATIQVAITLAGFFGSAFAADNFAGPLTDALWHTGSPFSREALHTISLVVVTLILSFFTLVLGELVPKRVAMKKAEALSLSMAGIIGTLSVLFRPIVWLLSVSTNGVLRLFGIDPNAADDTVYEEDIKDLADQGSRKGEIDSDEREIIHNLFAFDDISVSEIATHRTDMVVLDTADSDADWQKTIAESRHGFYPVCDESRDKIVGILSARDYLILADRSRENVMASAVRPVFFVPEGVRADVLFRRMKQAKEHFAVVLDEYGGVFGIVTMTDLLAQIVGDFDDESGEAEAPEIVQLAEDTWKIRGDAALDTVAETLKFELPTDEYDTFGGYIMGLHASVPADGTVFSIDTDDLAFTDCLVENRRIVTATVKRLPAKEPIEA